MNQAFTSTKFSWLGHRNDSPREYIGHHVAKWGLDSEVLLSSTLQNFLLAGVGSRSDSSHSDALGLMRDYLNPLAWPLDESQRLFDGGDLVEWSSADMRETIVAEMISHAVREEVRPILVQTDSDASYGLFAGACIASLGPRRANVPGYIRLSPSLLTLSTDPKGPSVGNSMSNLSKRFKQPFECLQLGVQEAINPKGAWVEASALGVNALTLAACEPDLLLLYLRNFCKSQETVLLSVDLDVLSEPYAPGTHRSTSFGLSLEVLLPAIRWIAGEGKLLGIELTGLGLEEDEKDVRPRLAASVIQDLLSHWF